LNALPVDVADFFAADLVACAAGALLFGVERGLAGNGGLASDHSTFDASPLP